MINKPAKILIKSAKIPNYVSITLISHGCVMKIEYQIEILKLKLKLKLKIYFPPPKGGGDTFNSLKN